MECFPLILEFFGGLILIFGIGYLIGHLLRLDKFIKQEDYDNS